MLQDKEILPKKRKYMFKSERENPKSSSENRMPIENQLEEML